MGEPCHDIMTIFRETAAADKVCLHAVQVIVCTHIQVDEAPQKLLVQEKLELPGVFHWQSQFKSGYFLDLLLCIKQ